MFLEFSFAQIGWNLRKSIFRATFVASYRENRKCYEKMLNTKIRPLNDLYQMQKRFFENIENYGFYTGKSKIRGPRLWDATLRDFSKWLKNRLSWAQTGSDAEIRLSLAGLSAEKKCEEK